MVERVMKYPVQPELLDFLRTVSRPSDRDTGGDLTGVYYDAARSRLFVHVPESRLAHVTALVEAADSPPRSVTVEAVLVLASLSSGQDFGVSWLAGWSPGRAELGTGTVAIGSGNLLISAGAFEIALTSAVSAGSATVISRPSVGSELGQKSSISSGREVGVVSTDSLNGNVVSSVDFKNVALSIEATVFQSGDNYRVSVIQKNDELDGSAVIDGRSVPEISTQSLETVLVLSPSMWSSAGSVVVERDSRSSSGFRLLPKSRKVSGSSRQEIGVFIRVLDGLRAAPVQRPSIIARPVEIPRAVPVKRRLFQK